MNHAALEYTPAGMAPPAWHCMALSDGVSGFTDSDDLQDFFIDAFIAAGEPPAMAIFKYHDYGNGFVVHWFSPEARSVAEHCNAVACDRPPVQPGMSLLLGDDGAWDLFAGAPPSPTPRTHGPAMSSLP